MVPLATVLYVVLLWSCRSGVYAAPTEPLHLSFHSDLNGPASPFPHTWRECVGSGHAALGLREDWQQHLKTVHDDLGFKRVRFHGLLNDDMSVILPDGSYSFTKIDTVYDYIISIGMYPFVELSFMPTALASGTKTLLHYKANITPPRSYEEWAKLITALAEHWLERYGRESIAQWYIEVWNEPDFQRRDLEFWSGTQEDYFKLYNYTALAMKAVSEDFRIGGPSTSQGEWLDDFIEFCHENQVPLDFVSTHLYSVRGTMRLMELFQIAESKVGGAYPLMITEFNSGGLLLLDNSDTSFAATYLAQAVPELSPTTAALAYWTFSDVVEELSRDLQSETFHDGYGLLTLEGIPKPAYRAFQLLNRLATHSYAVQWDGRKCLSVSGHVFHEPNSSSAQVLVSNFRPAKLNFGPLFDHPLTRNFITIICNIMLSSSLQSMISSPQEQRASTIDHESPIMSPGHKQPVNPFDQVRSDLPSTYNQPAVTMYRISPTEASPRAAWEEMESPHPLTQLQIDKLVEASEVNPTPLEYQLSPAGDLLTFSVNIPTGSMALVEITFPEKK